MSSKSSQVVNIHFQARNGARVRFNQEPLIKGGKFSSEGVIALGKKPPERPFIAAALFHNSRADNTSWYFLSPLAENLSVN
jgi:hypothetical protein